jgi:uncharacterized delta-60 repeat protein
MAGEARRPRAASRRGRRRLRPMAEALEGRALLSVGLDPTYGFGGEAILNVPANTATSTVAENISSIGLQNGQVVSVGSVTTTTFDSSGNFVSSSSNLVVTRFNTDGSIDTTFGSGGSQTIPVTSGNVTYQVTAADIVVQSDGKIDVLGTANTTSTTTSGEDDFVVAQLNSNGSIDTTFGTSGFELIDFNPASTSGTDAAALAVGPDGKLVAVGSTFSNTTNSEQFAIARLNTNGTLDPTFNGTGLATVSFNTGGSSATDDSADAVVVQPNDSIVVVGQADLPTSSNLTPSDVAVARLTPSGALDTTFHGTGTLTFSYNLGGNSVDVGAAVALEGTQIVIAGTTTELFASTDKRVGVQDLTVTRLNSDGSFDTTFNGSGKYMLSLTQGGIALGTSGSAVTVLSDGTLLVGGGATEPNSYNPSDGMLVNLTSAGTLNSSYGTNGVALLPASVGTRLLVQSDGKVLFVSGNDSVARTTAPAPAVASTSMIVVGTGKRAKATGVTITFNTDVNSTLATNASSFVVRAVKGRRIIRIKKKGISYNEATRTLTINFATRNPVGKGFQVVITPGAIVGADAQALSNNTIVIPLPTS